MKKGSKRFYAYIIDKRTYQMKIIIIYATDDEDAWEKAIDKTWISPYSRTHKLDKPWGLLYHITDAKPSLRTDEWCQ